MLVGPLNSKPMCHFTDNSILWSDRAAALSSMAEIIVAIIGVANINWQKKGCGYSYLEGLAL